MLHRISDAVWDAAIFVASTILAVVLTYWIWTIVKVIFSIIFLGGLLMTFMSLP